MFKYLKLRKPKSSASSADAAVARLLTTLKNMGMTPRHIVDIGAADIVKIDAEGLDLQVLDGAGETLSTTEIVLIEASVSNPDYPNSALAVIQKMDCLGFRLFDLTDLNRTPHRNLLRLVEAVFERKGSAIDEAASTFN